MLLIYSPEIPYCKYVAPSVVLTDDDGEELEIFSEVLFVGFDWKNNSFRSLTEKDFENIKSSISAE